MSSVFFSLHLFSSKATKPIIFLLTLLSASSSSDQRTSCTVPNLVFSLHILKKIFSIISTSKSISILNSLSLTPPSHLHNNIALINSYTSHTHCVPLLFWRRSQLPHNYTVPLLEPCHLFSPQQPRRFLLTSVPVRFMAADTLTLS